MKPTQKADLQRNYNNMQPKSKIKKKIFFPPFNAIRKGGRKIIRRNKRNIHKRKGVGVFLKKKFLRLACFSNKDKKKTKNPPTIYIQSTHNNTIYTVSRGQGLTDFSVSTGMCGFKNTRKSTSYASQMAAEKLAGLTKKRNFRVKIKWLGPGKLSGVRALHQFGIRITSIQECTGLPHNGCRASKRRRL